MSENEWIDLSDNMEKNDGYVKRDAQAIKERPGKYTLYVLLFVYLSTFFLSEMFVLKLHFI